LVKSGGETTQTAQPDTIESVALTQPANAEKVCSAVHIAGGEDIAVTTQAIGDNMPKANDDETIFPGTEIVAPLVEASALSIKEEFNPSSAAAAALSESHTGEASVEIKPKEEPVATTSASVAGSSIVKSEAPLLVGTNDVAAIEVSVTAQETSPDVKTESEAMKPANEDDAAEQSVQDEKPRGSPSNRSPESSSGMTSSCSGVRISC
jgi:hypothetical protein